MKPEIVMIIAYHIMILHSIVIAVRRRRFVAIPLTIFLPFIGYVISLMLGPRCKWCRETHGLFAKVCPHCGRLLKDGSLAKPDATIK